MKTFGIFSGVCVLAAAFALAGVHVIAGEQSEKAPADSIAKLLSECRQALAKGDRARAASLATEACRTDSKNREAILLQLFTTEAANVLSLANAAAREKLKQKVSFDFVETPLDDAVTFLQQITNQTIILHAKAAKNLPKATVTLRSTDVPLSQALDAMTKQLGLAFVVENGAIVIDTPEGARVRDIEPCTVRNCTIDLLDFPNTVKPSFTGYAFSYPASAFCLNDDRFILKIKGRLPAPEAADAVTAEVRRKYYRETALPEWLTETRKPLGRKVSFDFVQTPLRDCVTFLQQITNQNIVLDQKAPTNGKDAQVTLKVTDMPLYHALEWIASQAGLATAVRSNCVFITSQEQIAAEQEPGQYEFSRVAAELLSRGLKTEYSGLIFREPRTDTFFIIFNDVEGRELKLKGLVE